MTNNTPDLKMTHFRWSQIRIILLALTLFSFLGVILKLTFFPTEEKKQSNINSTFPETVPLSGWQLKESQKLKLIKTSRLGAGLAPGHIYKYVNNANNKDTLEVEARYEKYLGTINRYIVIYRNMPTATVAIKTKYKKDIGYYGTFEYQAQAFLTACVNPKGESTVTDKQFTKNTYFHGWGIQRTFLWVIGQQDLLDARCLWTIMSVPINSYDPYKLLLEKDLEDEYQKLETAWVDWFHWWKKNFPSY